MIRAFTSLILFAALALGACQTVPRQGGFTKKQVTVLKQNGFEPVGEDWQFGMADRLLFASDDSRLIPAQNDVITHMVRSLVSVGVHGARVEGHTDSVGRVRYNDALSLKRAQAVAGAMVAGGMGAEAIRVAGLGERAPIDNNSTALGRQENRRVVIIVSPADVLAP